MGARAGTIPPSRRRGTPQRRPRRLRCCAMRSLIPWLALLAACAAAPRALQVESSRELGALPFDASVHARDGGFSARFGARSVWLFGDTILSRPGVDGTRWRSSTVAWTTDLEA